MKICLSFLLLSLAGCARVERVQPAVQESAFDLRFEHREDTAGHSAALVCRVSGISAPDLAQLGKSQAKLEEWQTLLSVYVVQSGSSQPEKTDQPPMAGTYSVDDQGIVFQPRYPPGAGITYRMVFQPSRLPSSPKVKGGPIVAGYTAPKRANETSTVVAQVYPTASVLPENLLKFYIHFTGPMSRGEAYEHIKLLDAAGKPIESAFLELGEELWDPAGKRFTLFVDPGRIKHGLKPREDLGPVFENGKSYTLVIGNGWHDANGNPLKEAYRKSFKMGPPSEKNVEPKSWKLGAPKAGTRAPLTATFPAPLDHALLNRLVWVADADSQRTPGAIALADAETRWQFTPAAPWKAGTYLLVADTLLEDLCGNNIAGLFEVDVFKPIQREIKGKTVAVPFTVE